MIALIALGFMSLKTYVAYLDPGSGSFILQILIASLVGALFIVRVYWSKIKGFFQNIFKKERGDKEE